MSDDTNKPEMLPEIANPAGFAKDIEAAFKKHCNMESLELLSAVDCAFAAIVTITARSRQELLTTPTDEAFKKLRQICNAAFSCTMNSIEQWANENLRQACTTRPTPPKGTPSTG